MATDEHSSDTRSVTLWDGVVQVLTRHYFEPPIEAARVLYASVAAHYLQGQPVWPMAVAPPGSMKSELVAALEGVPNVHLIDTVTPKTFISGQIVDEGAATRSPSSTLRSSALRRTRAPW